VVWEALKGRLRLEQKERGVLAAVHVAPEQAADVPDEATARLVILPPTHPYLRGTATTSKAVALATEMVTTRGQAPRLNQNMLVFLAADQTRLPELENALRQKLAWDSIAQEPEALNLDVAQQKQVQEQLKQAEQNLATLLLEVYIWLLVPEQTNPMDGKSLQFKAQKLQGTEGVVLRASRKLQDEQDLLTEYGAVPLRMDLDRFGLWQDKPHLGLKQLWEYLARYPYLPRLRDREVLVRGVERAATGGQWWESVAYAEGWDGERYRGLLAGQGGTVLFTGEGVLVHPDAAKRQLAAEQAEREAREAERLRVLAEVKGDDGVVVGGGGNTAVAPVLPPTVVRDDNTPAPLSSWYFSGSIELDPVRLGRDAGTIAEEVVRHLLAQKGAKVTVRLELEAELPQGVDEQLRRVVTENANTLKFSDHHFGKK
jgi:uncharacterized protein